jgi:hypothetical protein
MLRDMLSLRFKYVKKLTIALNALPLDDGITLIDVGASGDIQPRWKQIQQFIRYIGFEPDERSRSALIVKPQNCYEYTIRPEALGKQNNENVDFYLCEKKEVSSLYYPRTDFLKLFPDSERFNVVKTSKVSLTSLDAIKIGRADFIKLDTQGKATLMWEDIDEGSSDNCSIKSRSLSKTEFTRTDGGDNKVTYTITDAGGNTSSVELTVRVDIVLASPERPKEANFLKAYPNPVSDYLYLEFAEGVSAGAIRSSSLVDASGKVIGELNLEDGGNGMLGFSTQSLKSGMYFLRLSTRDTLHLIKFTVIH